MESEVPLSNGCTLFYSTNEAGGRTYYSDEIGGGVLVWDTALVNTSTLLKALKTEYLLSTKKYKKEMDKLVIRKLINVISGTIELLENYQKYLAEPSNS